ncbi:MAG TPA: outer membrane lipoprotein chaperone LolA [Gammaproteobacteria bacterium]|nr:outer membrane lipoprotein chaperone LolA [Gammaproteobacteria bacterium]
MAVLGFALFSAAAQASGPERLADFFDGLTTLRAEFRQTVQDVRLNVNEQASGTVMIQRPGRFRWDYREPYEQLIVADGEKIWMYDVDLEQITVKPLDDTLGDTPAQLLSTTRPLEESFTVFDDGQADGLEWARLLPKSKDGNFQQVRLGFDGQTLRRMELQDSFNQTTRLDFSAVERNPPLDPAAFRFVPPPGVDVVGE